MPIPRKELPQQALLLSLLRYDGSTGKLYWNERPADMFEGRKRKASVCAKIWNAQNANREAFTVRCNFGHLRGGIHNKSWLAHRVIWMMVYGTDPDEIDHINGNPSDNRIENLRSVDRVNNIRNTTERSRKHNLPMGVYKNDALTGYQARIGVNKTYVRLGTFATIEQAEAARKEAEVMYGFHPNHNKKRKTTETTRS
jgi:hypothetical protein